MRQQLALGNVLRRRYMTGTNPFMEKRYNPKQVYIRSTDVNRTLISAYSNIAGMFAGGEAGKDFPNETDWPTGWTPVPVHTLPGDEDHAGNVFAPCPRADQLDEELRNSKEYKQIEEDNKDFLDYLSNNTGMKVDLRNIFLINDVHHIETIYNMSQPEWMTQEVSRRLRNLTSLVNGYNYGIGEPYEPELIRLRGGPMLRSLVDLMTHKKDCLDDNNQRSECKWIKPLRYYAYSAHDTTVAALLSTFGDETEVIRGGLPKYTASVAIELWTLDGEGPAVRILFHGDFHHNYHVITHLTKGCPVDKEFCPLEVFENRSLQFMPTDIKKECEGRERSNRTNQSRMIRKMNKRRMDKKAYLYIVNH
ncbi:histidine acid phosphatase [Cooperia oncophora]